MAIQGSLDLAEPNETGTLPSDEWIGERILSKYAAPSFADLDPDKMAAAVEAFYARGAFRSLLAFCDQHLRANFQELASLDQLGPSSNRPTCSKASIRAPR